MLLFVIRRGRRINWLLFYCAEITNIKKSKRLYSCEFILLKSFISRNACKGFRLKISLQEEANKPNATVIHLKQPTYLTMGPQHCQCTWTRSRLRPNQQQTHTHIRTSFARPVYLSISSCCCQRRESWTKLAFIFAHA